DSKKRQHKTFSEKLANNAPTAATKRETDCDFLASCGAASEQHVCQVKACHQQHDHRHPKQQWRDRDYLGVGPGRVTDCITRHSFGSDTKIIAIAPLLLGMAVV